MRLMIEARLEGAQTSASATEATIAGELAARPPGRMISASHGLVHSPNR